EPAGGASPGGPPHHVRAPRERPSAARDPERAPADHRDIAGSHAELVSRHLGQRRFESLPLRRHTGEDSNAAGGIGAHRRAFEWADARQLYVARDTDTEPAALLSRVQTFLAQPVPLRHLERAA